MALLNSTPKQVFAIEKARAFVMGMNTAEAEAATKDGYDFADSRYWTWHIHPLGPDQCYVYATEPDGYVIDYWREPLAPADTRGRVMFEFAI